MFALFHKKCAPEKEVKDMEKKNNRGEVFEEKDKSYKKWYIIFGIVIVVYIVLGSIFVFVKHILDFIDFIMVLPAILSIGLAMIAISQAMETRKIIDDISLESTYKKNPWSEAAILLNSADRGDHFLVSAVAGWPTEFEEVKEYIKANKRALGRGVYITRIFSFFNPKFFNLKSKLTENVENMAKEQRNWAGHIEVLVYYDEKEEKKGSMDYCILERGGTPKSAVLWLHDPGHPNKLLPGFRIENRRILDPLYDDFQQKFEDSISLDEYFEKTCKKQVIN